MMLTAQLRLHQTTASRRNTRSIPHIYPFSRIWLRFSIAGASCRHRASVIVTSQGWSSLSAAAVFRDVIAISGYHLPCRHFCKMAAILILCHLSSSWLFSPHCFTLSLAPSCVFLRHIYDEFLPLLQSWLPPGDVVTFENFDTQTTACYIDSFFSENRIKIKGDSASGQQHSG